jgi:hypothetical protein
MKSFYHEGQVEVDGETLNLVCDFAAIDCIESVTGENWDEIVPQLAKPSATLSTHLLWGLLRGKHEGVTLANAAYYVHNKKTAKKVGDCCWDVIARACDLVGDSKEESSKENTKKK